MVCKKDVVSWFKGLKSYSRIDLMCSLMNLCVPFELRYMGTCLEDMGKIDFIELRKTGSEANNLNDTSDLQSLTSPQVRSRLALYVSVLTSCNYSCSTKLFDILSKGDEVLNIVRSSSIDDSSLDDFLLIYTLAINHPAFSADQKFNLGETFDKLHEEEHRRYSSKSAYSQENSQGYSTCIPLEDTHLYQTHPLVQAIAPANIHSDPGITVHDGGGASLRMAYQPPLILNAGGWTMVGPPAASSGGGQTDSPRTGSPCSRPGSPGPGGSGLVVSQQIFTSSQRKFAPSRTPSTASTPNDSTLRDVIGKEMPTYMASLQNYSIDQLSRMTDDELLEVGLTPSAISQLKSILSAKHVVSNGIGPVPGSYQLHHHESSKKKDANHDIEVQGQRRYMSPVEGLYHAPGQCYSCYAVPPRKGCVAITPHHYGPQIGHHVAPLHLYAQQQGPVHLAPIMADLRISSSAPDDHSTASDTSSDHSPPDTPAPHLTVHPGGNAETHDERPAGGGNSGSEERRVGQGRIRGIGRNRSNPPGIQSLSRGRGLNPNQPHRRREIGGSASNGNSSSGSSGGGTNGGVSDTSTGGSATSAVAVTAGNYFGYMTAAGPYLRPAGAYPATATTYHHHHHHPSAYFKHPAQPPPYPPPTAYHNGTDILYQYPPPPVGTATVAPPTTFLPVPPPPPPYSPALSMQAPHHNKVPSVSPSTTSSTTTVTSSSSSSSATANTSCYNCGSQSHLALSCPEPTIDEIAKKGLYRIDFASSTFQKAPSGELSDK